MKWVTWEHIGVDRMGCAWLIMRFIDGQAEFVFIPSGSTSLPEGPEPFDIPGVRLSHRGGHSTFHTMLNEYHLDDPLLLRIANIIDEADVAQAVTLEPRAEGLDFICRGLRLISENDQIAVERGQLIYDAVYAQLKSESMK
ncbi:MAG TPA: chromate resistance protein ChrB domain-containing protein [Anaerolineales bacterium]|nr:chromate resistance protein ChrB domain-containing protein [Anaerolineales bacterium]